ncbi:MAG: ABC transporter ATP-binding protein [Elusimicrobia bacterium]|nr:ABC transporter ATP-binding protein [Elusimicrobiota bacterium]
MSGKIALEARGLGKKFTIGAREERRTVMEAVARTLTGSAPRRDLWAVRGLDLTVERGEILGVIGENGAGKSTLLLLLSRILGPSEGTLRVFGKTDPFFQLAAGLRPRLSVRDNMALCAALLGLSRADFQRRREEIVAFSELGEYLEARLGELSTGLAARLPFAAAIHADLDIILVDEMLSVGDLKFKAKCFKAFRSLAAQGKTIVVVSHDLDSVRALCARSLYLRGGRAEFLGETGEAIERLKTAAR